MLRQAYHILVISSCFLHKCILVLRQRSLGPGTRMARIEVRVGNLAFLRPNNSILAFYFFFGLEKMVWPFGFILAFLSSDKI